MAVDDELITIRMKWGHLADYAGDGARGKPILVGIFDVVFCTDDRPVAIPSCYIAAIFEAHVADGTDHTLEVRLANETGEDQMDRVKVPIRFGSRGPNMPLVSSLQIQLEGITVPDIGEYEFNLLIDDRPVGSVPFRVQPRR